VEGVRVKDKKTQQINLVPCAGVFCAFAGRVPNTGFLKGILELDEQGYIITDENMRTSQEGLFACGDCRKKSFRQIVTACGDGALAAYSAQRHLEKTRGEKI
jgi:thioredoxin reductase (NADPH)